MGPEDSRDVLNADVRTNKYFFNTFILKAPSQSTGKPGPVPALMRRNYGDIAHNFIIVVGLRFSRVLFVREQGLFLSVECIARVQPGSIQHHQHNSANKRWDDPQTNKFSLVS